MTSSLGGLAADFFRPMRPKEGEPVPTTHPPTHPAQPAPFPLLPVPALWPPRGCCTNPAGAPGAHHSWHPRILGEDASHQRSQSPPQFALASHVAHLCCPPLFRVPGRQAGRHLPGVSSLLPPLFESLLSFYLPQAHAPPSLTLLTNTGSKLGVRSEEQQYVSGR